MAQTPYIQSRFAEAEEESVAYLYRSTRTSDRMTRIQRNVHQGEGWGLLPRTRTAVLAVPAAAISPGPRNIPSATESGESFAEGITDTQAAPAVELHDLGLALGEQGIGHESVPVEDRVVVARLHAGSIA